ncbi:hypothetical protein WJX81_008539 [Elliptochloris bilobata]|uniref:Transmembrane protein n=1 Tax=Elliptochloris bilobata TaxID=381761 RepID=A0AAW1R302_9CHLO
MCTTGKKRGLGRAAQCATVSDVTFGSHVATDFYALKDAEAMKYADGFVLRGVKGACASVAARKALEHSSKPRAEAAKTPPPSKTPTKAPCVDQEILPLLRTTWRCAAAGDGRERAQVDTLEHAESRRNEQSSSEPCEGLQEASQLPSGEHNGPSNSSILQESDSAFSLKLLFTSFGGAAAVKYGSLLLDAPFQPNLALALSMIAIPVAVFSLFLLLKSREGA